MAKTPKLTILQLEVILYHNNYLIDAAQRTIGMLTKVEKWAEDSYIKGQVNYWQHVVKCLQWSNQLARQRHERLPNGGRTSVQ